MPDAVLVANKDNSKDIRAIVSCLKQKNISQSEVFPNTIDRGVGLSSFQWEPDPK